MANSISPSQSIDDVENAGEDGQEEEAEIDGEADVHQGEGHGDQERATQEELDEDKGQEEDATEAEAEEEAERSRGLRDPGKPSKSEIEEHELTHIPFRPWCRACVLGRAKDKLHMKLVVYANSGVPRVWD